MYIPRIGILLTLLICWTNETIALFLEKKHKNQTKYLKVKEGQSILESGKVKDSQMIRTFHYYTE